MIARLFAGLLGALALTTVIGAETKRPALAKTDAKPKMHLENQPAVGQLAPSFSLPSGDGPTVSLKDFKGKWVVLYFYPKDFTSGCTLEAKNFERDLSRYQSEGAVILGVSVDSAQSHHDFCIKERLDFKLLADPDAKTVTAYRSLTDYQGAKMAARNTFLIDPQGRIAKIYIGVNPASHSIQVLKDLAQLKKARL
ncbi:MAG: peroxiredoxin [Chthoniobacterales bacterium]